MRKTRKNIHYILSTNNCAIKEKALLLHAETKYINIIHASMTTRKVSIVNHYKNKLGRKTLMQQL